MPFVSSNINWVKKPKAQHGHVTICNTQNEQVSAKNNLSLTRNQRGKINNDASFGEMREELKK